MVPGISTAIEAAIDRCSAIPSCLRVLRLYENGVRGTKIAEGTLLPQERLSQNNPNWLHSDFKTIAYLHTHPVLLKMVQLGELNE